MSDEAASMLLYKPGSEVVLVGGIKGTIVAVKIEADLHVSYNVVWLHETTYTEMWFRDFMLEHPKAEKVRVGFFSG